MKKLLQVSKFVCLLKKTKNTFPRHHLIIIFFLFLLFIFDFFSSHDYCFR
jgi:hypothetical protein